MKRQIRPDAWVAVAAIIVTAVLAAPAAGQQLGAGDRITIMVPSLAPMEGARNNFGRDVAEELREQIDELHTHQTVSQRDIRRARREYDLSDEDLYNCVTARQLAMQMGWRLVLCGQYEETGDRQVHVTASFVGAENGIAFDVPPFDANDREPEEAARTILQTFDRYQTALRHEVFCQQYMDSEQWGEALRNCNTSLEINPNNPPALYRKAFTLHEMERNGESLETLERLLELDQIHGDGLKLAGIVATQAGQPERAREYFDRYMELNPGDVGVRLTVATEIANAGDPATAMAFAQEGLEVEPDNLNLLTYIGHFAANAASRAEAAMNSGQQNQGTIDPSQIQTYYQTAAEFYTRVFEQRGAETDAQILERLTVALFKLERYDEAISLGQRAIAARPDNANIMEAYSRALQEAGQLEAALAAIDSTQALGKDTPALTQRKGQMLLRLDRDQEAVETIVAGANAGQFEPTDAFRIIFGHAYQQEFQRGNLQAAFDLLDAAGPVAQAREDVLARNFWRGYILYQQGLQVHGPATAASAREALPVFERALELLQAARGYEEIHASADVPSIIDATQRYIEIEEALIERGR